MSAPGSSSEPCVWSMTIVRMQGMQSLRSDIRWRPEVCISFDDGSPLTHKFVLGVDGRNPNLKTLIPIPRSCHRVTPGSRLSIEVFCRAPTAKKQGKSTPLCFALVPLSDVLRKHDPDPSRHRARRVEHEVALVRVNAPRGNLKAAAQKRETPKLLLRFQAPETLPPSATLPESTGIAANEDAPVAHNTSHQASDQESDTVVPTDCEAGPSTASSSPIPAAKIPAIAFSACGRPRGNLRKRSVDTSPVTNTNTSRPAPLLDDVASQPGAESLERQEGRRSPRRTWLQLAEACVNYVGPYDELQEAEEHSDDQQVEAVLARLVAEWQAVGQMLLGLAAVNTAVIGFVSGSTVFAIDDFSLGAVTIGAIAAGLGMALDAWFFVLFSGADAAKFKRLAKDVYGTYFFFSLACRLPTLHMSASALALALFLLSTAWAHSPTTALVAFCIFGVFVGSQILACVLRIRRGPVRTPRLRPRRTRRAVRAFSHRPVVSSSSGGLPESPLEMDVVKAHDA